MRFIFLRTIFVILLVSNSLFGLPSEQPSNEASISHRLDELERRLKAIQNMQDVEIIDISLSGFSNKNDFLKFKRNEVLQQMKDIIGSKYSWFRKAFDLFPAAAHEFIIVVAMKSNWNTKRLVIPNIFKFIESYVSLLPNFCSYEKKITSISFPIVILNCGHNICVKCLILVASKSINFQLNVIWCISCLLNTYFDINTFCKLFDDSSENTIDMLSKIKRKSLLYSLENPLYKKCPKKSCDCIMKFSPNINLIQNMPSIATCPNGHTFCLNCHSSSEIHYFLCSSSLEIFVFREKLYFSDKFAIKIAKTQTICRRCDRLMFKIDSSEIDLKPVCEFLGDNSFLFCAYCFHLQAEDVNKNSPGFYNALSLEYKISGDCFSLLITHVKLLKKHYFILISTVLMCYSYYTKNNFSETITDAFLNAFIIIYDRFLKIYYKCIEDYLSEQSSVNLGRLLVFMTQLSYILKESTVETDCEKYEASSKSELIHDFDISYGNASFLQKEFTHHQLFILLCHIIKTKLHHIYKSQTSVAIERDEHPVTDHIRPILEQAKSFLMVKQDLRIAMEDMLDRPLNDFDFYCMVYSSQIDSLYTLNSTEVECRNFFSACKIPIPKTCVFCIKRFIEAEHVLPDCLHDLACKECIIENFKSCVEQRKWNAKGFILCVDVNCSGIFQPSVVLEYLSKDHSVLRERYENILFSIFYRAYSKNEKLIECVKCGHYLQIKRGSQDMHDLSGEDDFIKEYDLYLKTVQCPNCFQKMCFNCRQPTVHYSSHCGISTQIDTASMATMCPGCKVFSIRSAGCPSMMCNECKAEFCARCSREPFFSATCYNSTYPTGQYSDEQAKVIDAYYQKCAQFLQPHLQFYHIKLSAATRILKNSENSSKSEFRRLACLLNASIEFFQWHSLLKHYTSWEAIKQIYIKSNFNESDANLVVIGLRAKILTNLNAIQLSTDKCKDNLIGGYILMCLNLLYDLMKMIETQHELFQQFKTSSRVILPKKIQLKH